MNSNKNKITFSYKQKIERRKASQSPLKKNDEKKNTNTIEIQIKQDKKRNPSSAPSVQTLDKTSLNKLIKRGQNNKSMAFLHTVDLSPKNEKKIPEAIIASDTKISEELLINMKPVLERLPSITMEVNKIIFLSFSIT